MNNTSKRKLSKKELRQKRKIERTVGLALTVVMLILMAVFVGLLISIDVLPTVYIIAIVVVMILLLLYVFLSQFTKAHMIGKVLAVIMSILFAIGSFYLAKTFVALDDIGNNGEMDVMSIVVLKDSSAQSVADTKDLSYGVYKGNGADLVDNTLKEVEEKTGAKVSVIEYNNWAEVVNALYSQDVQVIILNESYRATIEGIEYYAKFSEDTRVLGYNEIKNDPIDLNVPDKEITDETFTVLLSGMDNEGKLGTKGHSDVNIIATVNPTTREVLLVTTPRDTYLTFYYGDGTSSGSGKSKLTHSGNSGIACTLTTLEKYYDIDIDYYVRLNFTGLMKLVDALGGIEVESDYAFTSYAKTHTYVKGVNKMDGYAALIFARERHAFADGDFQRNRNQIKVINAIMDKILSPTILTSYTGIMESLSDWVSTNIPQKQITNLVKAQLEDMSGWTIKSFNMTGGTGSEYCFDSGMNLSIVYEDANMKELAKAKMKAVEQGIDPDTITSVQ